MSLAVTAAVSACNAKRSIQNSNSGSIIPLTAELDVKLKEFFSAKEKEARDLEKSDLTRWADVDTNPFVKHGLPRDVWQYFAAGKTGDWERTTELYYAIANRSYQFETPGPRDERLATTAWQPINEAFRAYEQVSGADPKCILAYGQHIIGSIPRRSIYLAGTDAGRFVLTLLCHSPSPDAPFFIISQNALADGLYLEYLSTTYGTQISVPTPEDSQKAFTDYLADAQRRLSEKKLEPDEDVKIIDGRVQVAGAGGVKGINALLVKALFERNPDHEFFLDDGGWTKLDWMYPHLVPHGFIFRLNRFTVPALSDEIVQRDRAFWAKHLSQTIGDWLTQTTSVAEICDFTEKVFLRKDLSDFKGDPQFVRTARNWTQSLEHVGASPVLSRSRSNIADLYAWRAQNSSSPEEKQRMTHEADFAFRQALALCTYQSSIMNSYCNFLLKQNRFEDALRLTETVGKFFPEDQRYQKFIRQVTDKIKP